MAPQEDQKILSLRVLAAFCIQRCLPHRTVLLQHSNSDELLNKTRFLLFPTPDGDMLPNGYDDWTNEQF